MTKLIKLGAWDAARRFASSSRAVNVIKGVAAHHRRNVVALFAFSRQAITAASTLLSFNCTVPKADLQFQVHIYHSGGASLVV